MTFGVEEKLWNVRRLRLEQERHNRRAVDYLLCAQVGMGKQRATDMGGTGHCPLTDFATQYGKERELWLEAKKRADDAWSILAPQVMKLPDLDMRLIIEYYYNAAMDWSEVCKVVKRRQMSAFKLHKAGILSLEKL